MPKLIKAYKKDFTIIDNQIFKDKRLGCKDLGLLCLMFSLPDDWEFSIYGLSTVCKDGKDSIRTGIETLERYGYLTRKQARNAKGSFDGYDYYLYMDPKDNEYFPPKEDTPTLDIPMAENPTTDKPMMDEPSLDYPTQENKQEERKKQENTSYYNNKEIHKNSTESATRMDGSKIVVDEKTADLFFDRQRITKACATEILRLNEATRDSALSRRIVDYLSDSCNCYGTNQIRIINQLPDSDLRKLFEVTSGIVNEDPGTETLNNPKAYLSSEIGKCIEKYKQRN